MKAVVFIFILAVLAVIFGFIFLFLLPQSAWGGGVYKVVTGFVTTSQGVVPADKDLSFEAYIVGREKDKLKENKKGCGYSAGLWWVTVSNFAGTWSIGEILRVAFSDAGSGESNALEVVLDSNTTQNTGDFSLPVELSLFTATTSSAGVLLRWRTESEVNNIGFAIYRSEAKDGKYGKIAFVEGAGNSAMANDYQYLDKKVEIGKTYFYYLEDVDIVGERSKSEIIKKAPLMKRAALWSQIKAAR